MIDTTKPWFMINKKTYDRQNIQNKYNAESSYSSFKDDDNLWTNIQFENKSYPAAIWEDKMCLSNGDRKSCTRELPFLYIADDNF